MLVSGRCFPCIYTVLLKPHVFIYTQKCLTSQLLEIGRLDTPKNTNYEPGQMFVHKLFGYRGIVLFGWLTRIYDQGATDVCRVSSAADKPTQMFNHSYNYLALMDTRDSPFASVENEPTFFRSLRSMYGFKYFIPDLDLVFHEDMLPYTTTETESFKHNLFEKFFVYDPSKQSSFKTTRALDEWQKKYNPRLGLSNAYKATTENIQVTTIPLYTGYRNTRRKNVHWWRVSVRIENLGESTVTLSSRHWQVFSMSSLSRTLRGRGVGGQVKILSQLSPAFQYSSHVSLIAPRGCMWGTFTLKREDESSFECRIPLLLLQSKESDKNIVAAP
uniref:ApaG domain-containing protein n=1 Tax=Graphocephala atropunctata TaxID=36148 RepID=A0A1B6KU19_9HEMI